MEHFHNSRKSCPVPSPSSPFYPVAAAAKSHQSCPTLCDPIDGSPPGSHPWNSPGKNTGVGCRFLLQCMKVKSLSRVRLFETPWSVAYQAPPSMGFSRQEYWSGVPLPSPLSTLGPRKSLISPQICFAHFTSFICVVSYNTYSLCLASFAKHIYTF